MVSVNLFFYLTIQPAFSHKNHGSTGQLSVKNQPIFQFATVVLSIVFIKMSKIIYHALEDQIVQLIRISNHRFFEKATNFKVKLKNSKFPPFQNQTRTYLLRVRGQYPLAANTRTHGASIQGRRFSHWAFNNFLEEKT